MKKAIKKVVTTVLTTGMLLSMSTFSVLAAGNYTDTYFYNFLIRENIKYTPTRQKLDATSATVKLSKSPYGVVVRVYGSTYSEGAKNDCTYGTPKIVSVSSTYTYLPNLVYERGYSWASLGFTRADVLNSTISGAWSPDSI